MMKGRPRNTAETFWQKVWVEGPDDCWPWKLSLRNGYGNFCINKVSGYAHRFAYEAAKGAIPDGLQVMHRCNNKRCCNPAHLKLGTPSENTQDAYDDGLATGMQGEKHHNARLTAEMALAIFNDLRTYTVIGEAYGIAMTTVSGIKNGYSWAHVTGGRRGSKAA